VLALALALILQTAAAADSTAVELLARGEKLLADLEYDAAAAELMRAAAAPDATDAQRVRAHLLAGVANRVAGRDADARLNFRNVLFAAPGTRLPEGTSPKVASFFEAVRQEVEAERAAGKTKSVQVAPLAPDAAPASKGAAPARSTTPPPDARTRAGAWPYLIAGAGGIATVGAGTVFTYTYLDGGVRRDRVDTALQTYEAEPTVENRRALVDRTREFEDAAGVHNCSVVPFACLFVPAGLAAIAVGTGWGIYDGVAE
jgi:hypothetical protein